MALLGVPNMLEKEAAGLDSPPLFPKRLERGFGVDPVVLVKPPKRFEGLPVLVGVAAVTLTVGAESCPSLCGVALPNLIGLLGSHV
jgi:hypothetical protein